MIHQLLTLTRPLVVLDTETTGLDVQTCRIVELAFQVWYPDTTLCPACRGARKIDDPPCLSCDGAGRHYVKEWRTLINPGVLISAEVSAIHGIRDEHVTGCQRCDRSLDFHRGDAMLPGAPTRACKGFKPWPTFKQLAASLAKGFTDCDYAGQNVRYDLRILDAEMRRAGQPWSYVGARVVDSVRLEALAEPRNLATLYKKYTGRDHEGAHGALADVRATSAVIAAQLARHEALPRDLDKLHEAQWPGWLCDDGSFAMVDGVATCQFGKHRGKKMKDMPNDYFDWLLRSEFPNDVKALAANAKLGIFPDGPA